MNVIQLLLVDDHRIFLDGLESLFSQEEGLKVLGTARSGAECLQVLRLQKPDVVLLDINMVVELSEAKGNESTDQPTHKQTGVDLIEPIRALAPDAAIVMLTMHDEDEFIRQAMQKGVEAYVLKDATREELLEAIQKAHSRQFYYSRGVTDAVMRNLRQPQGNSEVTLSLTKREVEMVQCIASGLQNQEIADRLFISLNTVKSHRKNLYSKTEVRNTAELIRFAKENGLLKD